MGAKMKKLLILSALISCANMAFSETLLTVKPNKCVSLHKGQMCYQKLKFSWQSDTGVCLYIQNNDAPLHCAEPGVGQWVYDFESERGQQFELRDREGGALAEVTVDVASVYQGQRRATTGWRIF